MKKFFTLIALAVMAAAPSQLLPKRALPRLHIGTSTSSSKEMKM